MERFEKAGLKLQKRMKKMPTGQYKLSNGKLVVGTTTVIGRFKDSNALIHWAWDCGKKRV